MNKTQNTRLLSFLLCAVLIAAMALSMTGCNGAKTPDPQKTPPQSVSFTFEVIDGEGKTTTFPIETDKQSVGEALMAKGLIEGEESQYGLYVKKVNGITADYDVDGTYWAFYVNGEYAMSGVEKTTPVDGAVYTFKVER